MAITYEILSERNPEHDGTRWRIIRALASGDRAVRDHEVLSHLLPKREGEPQAVYDLRLQQAWYAPYLGRLVGQVVSSLGTDPLSVQIDGDDEEQGVTEGPASWYHEFADDVSAPDGQRQSLDEFMCAQARTALLTGRAWTLVDLPESKGEVKNLATELQAGYLDAYLCAVDPGDVLDWEWDEESDRLAWAIVRQVRVPRRSFEQRRDTVEESFVLYTEDSWTRFVFVYPTGEPPSDDALPTRTEKGSHSFGRVPLVPLELPDDLRLGEALESTAVELFRKSNALSWSEDRGLFAQLVETSDPDPKAMMAAEIGNTPDIEQQGAGPGTVLRTRPGSALEYLAPPEHVYRVAQEKVVHLRDEMYRVVNQIALAANSTGAALGRSAESKGLDMAALSVMLGEIGRHVREHTDRVLETVAAGRGDYLPVKSGGMREFELVDRGALIEEAQRVIGRQDGKGVSVPSRTFIAQYSYEFARQMLPAATREELAVIKRELEEAGGEDQEGTPPEKEGASEQDRGDSETLRRQAPEDQRPTPT